MYSHLVIEGSHLLGQPDDFVCASTDVSSAMAQKIEMIGLFMNGFISVTFIQFARLNDVLFN